MPEMHFRVRFPNGATIDCYSPSYVIEDYLSEGQSYAVSRSFWSARERRSTLPLSACVSATASAAAPRSTNSPRSNTAASRLSAEELAAARARARVREARPARRARQDATQPSTTP